MNDDELLRHAAAMGGKLMDFSSQPDTADGEVRQMWRLAEAGMFEHVADPGQVPYFRLTAAGEAAARAVA